MNDPFLPTDQVKRIGECGEEVYNSRAGCHVRTTCRSCNKPIHKGLSIVVTRNDGNFDFTVPMCRECAQSHPKVVLFLMEKGGAQ